MRYLYKMVNIRSYLKNAKIPKSPFRFRLEKMLHDGMEELVTKDSEIRYKVTVGGAEYSIEDTVPKKYVSFKIQNFEKVKTKNKRIMKLTQDQISEFIAEMARSPKVPIRRS